MMKLKEKQGNVEHEETSSEAVPNKNAIDTKINVKKESEMSVKSEVMDESFDKTLMPPPSSTDSAPTSRVKSELSAKRDGSKDNKPLASMLPEKYKDTDVVELFPEFRHNSVLRFSRLFPIKSCHMPKIWNSVGKKKVKVEDQATTEKINSESTKKSEKEWKFDYAPFPEDPKAYMEDGVVSFHKPKEEKKEEQQSGDKEDEKKGPKPSDWRWGPAQYWYDMLGLPENVQNYDYGLKSAGEHMDDVSSKKETTKPKDVKVEEKENQEPSTSTKRKVDIDFSPDAFLMVTQVNWEDDVIWNGDEIRHKVMQKLNSKSNAAGWVPTGFNRTAGSFSQPGKNSLPGIKLQTLQHKRPENTDDTFYSIFPVENEELSYGRWEDEVIWDSENMPEKLAPKMVSLDPNDDNIILGIPDDIDPSTLPSDQPLKKVKIIQKHVKKSRMLLNRSGIISVVEEESPPPPPKTDDKDPFNISNDEFYAPKAQEALIKTATGGTLLQHATPVVELQVPHVPTYINQIKLRQFHRWPLKKFSHGPLANLNQSHGVNPLTKYMKKKAKTRELEREAAGGGEIFFMRTPEDVSGKDGELILFEYIEEHPPLLSLVGMASKIKNYYKRKPGSDAALKEKDSKFKYGEITIAHTSPFLGQMAPGQTIQTIENNLYRSPIFEHKLPMSDFVVIRTRNEYFIREADSLMTVGQECPLYEIPGPNSKRANNFTRDFLQVFIYRLFWKSKDDPRRIKMDEIKRAFPSHSESSIRKRLKPCAEFHRTGHDSNWWVIKPNFRLPSEEEMRAMVTPEQCCAFFSMSAAEQRLRDAGYGEKFLLASQDDDDEESSSKLDDEVKVAPWNTTRAYMLAMKGKCLLQLTGPADPTGPAGEGFSYIRIPNKPTNKEDQEQQPKRIVTGTDSDLRKLPLKDAKNILRKNGVPEEEIKKLSRWEVIDVVRTLSTEKVKAGEDGDHKFSRGNRFSIAEHQERYREDCQRIFETQNKVLASDEILSSDDEESSEEEDANDEDLYEMGKNMENMLSNKKTSSQFLREREEAERRKLQAMMRDGTFESESSQTPSKRKKDQENEDADGAGPSKVLRITRVFKNPEGKEYKRTELVRKPMVIDAYVNVRENKDENFIRNIANTLDDNVKEEMKKEKRRIQEQLRRLKRNEEKVKLGLAKTTKRKLKQQQQQQQQQQKLNDLKLKCGACGAKGHMRTNKACPKFIPGEFDGPINVAMTEQDEQELEKELLQEDPNEELINVDGTKMTLSAKLLKQADEVRKKTMVVKVPKKVLKGAGKRKRAGTVEHCDYLTNKNYKPVKRRRTDPVVSFASFLENLHSELRVMDDALQFLQPVNTKKVPDYLDKVKNPMDLQTIRENIQRKKYRTRKDFLQDIVQIVENSRIYNGGDDIYTKSAERLEQAVIKNFYENEEKLQKIEKAINPLLDDDSQVALTYVIKQILDEKIKTMQESWPFMKPVNRKQMKHYYDIIKQPMDLETIGKKVSQQSYHSRDDFLADIKLILKNSTDFNGPNSEYTMKAQKILEIARDALEPYDDELGKLEDRIREVQRIAMEEVEADSLPVSLEQEDGQPAKKKRGRPRKKKPPLTSEFIDVGSEEESGGSKMMTRTQDPNSSIRKRTSESNLGNLMDDLQYTSEEEDDDGDDEDWEQVGAADEEEGLTVTVEEQPQNVVTMKEGQIIGGFYQEIQAGDQAVQIEAPNIVYHEQEVQQEEEQFDENYDPSDFLHNLGKQSQDIEIQEASAIALEQNQIPMDVDMSSSQPLAVQSFDPSQAEVVAEGTIDVINDDLDISDSDEEDTVNQDSPSLNAPNIDDRTVVAPQAPPLIPEPPPPDEDGLWF